MKSLLSLYFILVTFLVQSQNIGIGEWRSHQSYYQAKKIVQANNSIFCSTQNGLFAYDLEDNSVTKFTRERGLGSAGISSLHFSETQQVLIIGYADGIIDLLKSDGQIKTLKSIRDAAIVASKEIRDIVSEGSIAYLATDFGIVVLDLVNEVVKENFRNIGPEAAQVAVSDLLITSDSLLIITNLGIQSGSFDDNLLDFNEWVFYPETGPTFGHISEWEDQVYAVRNGIELWRLSTDSWVSTGLNFSEPINHFVSVEDFYALSDNSIFTVLPNPTLQESPTDLVKGRQFLRTGNDFWIADEQNGLLQIGTANDRILPSGPRNDSPSRLKWVNGKTYALFGPVAEDYDGTSDGLGFSAFENGQWNFIELLDFYNITDVAGIGQDLYFTSMGFGLYDLAKQEILNHQNSEFTLSNSFGTVQLSSIQEFQNELFIASYNSTQPLYKFSESGISTYTSGQLNTQFPRNMDVSRGGVLWIERGVSDGGGIAIFDAETIESRLIRTSDGLPSTNVSGISIDYDDEAWISTTNGPVSYSGASFPFNEFGVTAPIFENGFLFQGEQINDILTDGGNRIWFATDQGVWVLSKSLTEVIYRFDVDNSPLLSNTVLEFSYDDSTGEVFMLTSKGLISFRSGSSFGELVSQDEVHIFPNPVLSTFSGKVGISGLVRDAQVKITDTKGRLIASLNANGGTAEWNVTNHLGDRVGTGIYLVFSSNEDGTETAVGKIAVIR